jgi:pSer/pThr/pTyr-binding forkhead associated (FHA) protein
MLQDFGSLNGTFVNGQRAKIIMLKPGDSVAIGKHTIVVTDSVEVRARSLDHTELKPVVPKMNETVMLDTKDRREFLEKVAAVGESAQPAPGRMKIPTLVVRNGNTDRPEYALNDKLTVVGKSAMATVKLRGWFKPKAAAQINRKEDNSYYIGAADKTPSVNGEPITHPTKLASGDLIEVAGVELEFVVRD